jgi:hypothetical protein
VSRALDAAGRRLLPSGPVTTALRAALWDGDAGRAAFERWAAELGDPRDVPSARRQPLRELAPQLDAARLRHGGRASGSLAVLLHAAADHERRRWTPYRQAAVDLLGEEPDPLVSGGLATALAAHPDPAVRHCHDLDRLGPVGSYETHPSGLPAVVHPGLLPPAWGADEDLDAVRARAVLDGRLGRPVHRVGVGDLLITVLVHHVAGRRFGSVRWASDVWLLARVATDDDWDVLAHTVAEHRLGPVVLPSLTYVAEALRATVPAAAVATVQSSPAPSADRIDLALRWAARHHQRPRRVRRAARAVRRRLVR